MIPSPSGSCRCSARRLTLVWLADKPNISLICFGLQSSKKDAPLYGILVGEKPKGFEFFGLVYQRCDKTPKLLLITRRQTKSLSLRHTLLESRQRHFLDQPRCRE